MKKRTFISFIAFFLANFFTLAIFAAVQPEQLPANQGDTSTSLAPFSLTSHNPTTNAIGIPLNTAVTATFDANVAPASVTTTTFAAHTSFGGLLTGTLSVSGNTITLNPNRNFFTGELVQIIATAGISSTDGISLTTPTQWEFITGPVGPLNRCAGGFTPVTTNLTPVRDGSVAWGDYDNDGDLDLLLAGESTAGSISQVYRNDNNVFTDIAAGLVGADDSSVAWGDYDNDGDLDILLVGSSFIAKVYRNDAGIFTDINAGLDGASRGSVDWGDYDNDGDLDILLTGGFGVAISRVYRNDNGAFVDIGAGLTGVELSSVDWGDYDNDGDLDILLSGDNFGRVSHVYRNDAGVFTNIGAGLETVRQSSVDWGDYDDDGDLDILLTGFNGVTSISHIYRNDAGTFTNINAGLSGLTQGHSAWGDYDNDGDLDILMTGLDIASTETTTKLYRNDAGSFTAIDAGLTNVQLSSVAWGDYDNDGDLDILLTGQDTSFTRVAQLYRNDDCSPISLTAQEPVPNAVGVAITPTISATFDGDIRANSVTDSAFIAHTNFTGVVTGTLAVINDTVTFDLSRNLFTGEQVQLIVTDEIQRISDNRRSAPTQWGFTAGPVTSRCVQDFTELSWTGLTGASNSSAAWGDYDNDGDLDMVVIGRVDFATLMSTIYRNDGTAFTDIGAGLTPVEFGRVAWGDYDNDGDLDILLTGFDGSVQLSQIYRNDAGSFTNINASLLPTVLGDIAWGDYDNDGDLDILLTGANGSTKISRIYR
ncbi:MAG TPA: FG-GAP-like repeat-containing protein, partial [Anaerolineae bacterium]|nr:FG-GAP-like repeat-containing protein [Anaerolineae bacterium]